MGEVGEDEEKKRMEKRNGLFSKFNSFENY